jgi:hypothetical protein
MSLCMSKRVAISLSSHARDRNLVDVQLSPSWGLVAAEAFFSLGHARSRAMRMAFLQSTDGPIGSYLRRIRRLFKAWRDNPSMPAARP